MASPVALTVKNLPAMQKTRVDPWIRKIPWRRKWQPTSEFLPGESLGPRSLVGYSPWGRKSQTRLKQLSTHTHVPGGLCFLRKIISRVWIPLMQKATRPQKPHQIQSSQPHLVLGFVVIFWREADSACRAGPLALIPHLHSPLPLAPCLLLFLLPPLHPPHLMGSLPWSKLPVFVECAD